MPDFVPILNADTLSPGQVTTVSINGHNICLANHEGAFYALDNLCPHKGGQLGDGELSGCDVVCPLHQWDFDVRTGVSRYNPKDKVATYPVRVKDGKVEIDAAAVPPIPVVEGYLKQWDHTGESEAEPDIDTIHKLAKGGGEQHEPMRTTRKVPDFDSLYFLPGQLAERPLRLALPVYIIHRRF
ncbi:MAG: Rieske 2Fe-2S domain-containing protein [Gammaproteobacteria bacterium]|jgi:nitrite reductase/ring-hydroxylating ferredoxin subunit|nr:Rieske 2Fe-2S domain-containing protein [Gammaproteobacteria bacterium]